MTSRRAALRRNDMRNERIRIDEECHLDPRERNPYPLRSRNTGKRRECTNSTGDLAIKQPHRLGYLESRCASGTAGFPLCGLLMQRPYHWCTRHTGALTWPAPRPGQRHESTLRLACGNDGGCPGAAATPGFWGCGPQPSSIWGCGPQPQIEEGRGAYPAASRHGRTGNSRGTARRGLFRTGTPPKAGSRLAREAADDEIPVAAACRVLNVSTSGYCEWPRRPESPHHRGKRATGCYRLVNRYQPENRAGRRRARHNDFPAPSGREVPILYSGHGTRYTSRASHVPASHVPGFRAASRRSGDR